MIDTSPLPGVTLARLIGVEPKTFHHAQSLIAAEWQGVIKCLLAHGDELVQVEQKREKWSREEQTVVRMVTINLTLP